MGILSQYIMVGALSLVYVVRPQAVHRFVGYLEETAVVTYTSLIEKTKTPGTHLYRSWSNLKAPHMAKAYWNHLEDEDAWDTPVQIVEQPEGAPHGQGLLESSRRRRRLGHTCTDRGAT